MHLYVHKYSVQSQNFSCLMWWMLPSSRGWLVYSGDASLSHQVEPLGHCEHQKRATMTKAVFFWRCDEHVCSVYFASLPAVSKKTTLYDVWTMCIIPFLI